MFANDNSIQTGRQDKIFKNVGRSSAKASANSATNVFNNPESALEVGTAIVGAAPSKNLEAVLATTPDAISFYHTGRGLYLEKVCRKYNF